MGRIAHFVLIGVALPCILSFVVYYGFFSDYAGAGFHREGFRRYYESGVVKYRVLGRELLLNVHSVVVSPTRAGYWLRKLLPNAPRCLPMADPKGNAYFYGALFIWNTLCLVGASWLLYAFLRKSAAAPWQQAAALGRHAVGLFLMAITQFVPSAYDLLTCVFLLAAAYCMVYGGRWGYPLALACMLMGTLTRESAVLVAVFFLAYHFDDVLRLRRQPLLKLVGLLAVFAVTYMALRFAYGFDHAMWQMVRWRLNLTDPKSLCGLLALPVVCWAIMAGAAHRRCWVFLGACLPYVAAMTLVANTWEIRLWVPVWLGLLLLAHLDTGRETAATA